MSKRTLTITYLIGLVIAGFATVGFVDSLIQSHADILAAQSCKDDIYPSMCLQVYSTHSQGLMFISGAILLFNVPYLIGWVGMLIHFWQARNWRWFILTVLFSGLAIPIYVLKGETIPKRSIAIAYIIGLAIAALALVGFANSVFQYTTDIRGVGGACGDIDPMCFQDYTSLAQGNMFISGAILLFNIPYLIGWVGTLLNFSYARKWVWFILTVFFSGLIIPIYILISQPPKEAATHSSQHVTPS